MEPIQVEVEIRVGNENNSIIFEKYKAYVKRGQAVKWVVRVIWDETLSPLPSLPIWVAMFGFLPKTSGSPPNPFNDFASFGGELIISKERDNEAIATVTSLSVEATQEGDYQFEYVIFIFNNEDVLAKIDPLLVISG
jgi:hypothetical protein